MKLRFWTVIFFFIIQRLNLLTFYKSNRIYFIESKTFDGLKLLTYLNLELNIYINERGANIEESNNIIRKVKTTCNNLDYFGIENELKKLQNSLVCVNSETLSVFEPKFQSKFNKPTLAQSVTISGELKDIGG